MIRGKASGGFFPSSDPFAVDTQQLHSQEPAHVQLPKATPQVQAPQPTTPDVLSQFAPAKEKPAPEAAPAPAPAPQAGPAVAMLQQRADPIDAGAGWAQVSTPGRVSPGLGQRLPFSPARSAGIRY